MLYKRLEMQTKIVGLGTMDQLHKHEVLGSDPQHLCEKPGPAVDTCNPKLGSRHRRGSLGSETSLINKLQVQW